jgi:hypothetical protein
MKNKQKDKKSDRVVIDYFSLIKENNLSIKKIGGWWEIKTLDNKIVMDESLERAITLIININ